MESNEYQLIPDAIVDAWLRGEYYSGDLPSIPYQYIGISLALRGWYIYEAQTETETKLKGISKIDFSEGSLSIGGIRLFTGQDGDKRNLFWVSEFSHFLNENEILWVYKIFNCDIGAEWLRAYISDSALSSTVEHFNEKCFGLAKEDWNQLLDRIRSSLFNDLRIIECDCEQRNMRVDRGLLHFFIKEKIAQYRQIYSPEYTGSLIAGEANYTRVIKL